MRLFTMIKWNLSLGCSSAYTNSMTPCINKTKGKGDLTQQMEKSTLSHGKNKPAESWERFGRRMKAMYGKPVEKGDRQVHSPHSLPKLTLALRDARLYS